MEEKIVFSAFDGMSCLQQALDRSGIHYDRYYASEIDKYAIKVTQANYPETIQMGSIVDIKPEQLPKIWLFAGGSPCQSFSFSGKRKGMATKDEVEILTLEHYLQLKSEGYEFEGQSYLFWEYMRILTEVRKRNPQIKFLLENVKMSEKWENILTRAIGVHPIEINSALVSAQNRPRLYWTNIGMEPGGLFGDPVSIIKQPMDREILLVDVLDAAADHKYFLSDKMIAGLFKHSEEAKANGKGFNFNPTDGKVKAKCLTAHSYKMGVDDNYVVCLRTVRSEESKAIRRQHNKTGVDWSPYRKKEIVQRTDGKVGTLLTNPGPDNYILFNEGIRRLTPDECERLQTVEVGYTNHVSDTQRYRMLGNGWTIEVIMHILSYL